MATATKQVEQIVRKVMSEEMDETVNAIQEISTLLTEQVIPRLSGEPGGESGMDEGEGGAEEADEGSTNGMRARSMSGFNGRGSKPGRGRPNGHDDSGDVETPERDVPEAVMTAFEELYKSLSPEQARGFVELFTAIESELDDQDQDELEDEDQGAEAFGRG